MNKQEKPTWWQLYGITIVGIGAFFVEHAAPMTPVEHRIVLIVTMGVMYGLMYGWIRHNHFAIETSRRRDIQPTINRIQAHYRQVMMSADAKHRVNRDNDPTKAS